MEKLMGVDAKVKLLEGLTVLQRMEVQEKDAL